MREHIWRRAAAAENPETSEIECPNDFSCVVTAKFPPDAVIDQQEKEQVTFRLAAKRGELADSGPGRLVAYFHRLALAAARK